MNYVGPERRVNDRDTRLVDLYPHPTEYPPVEERRLSVPCVNCGARGCLRVQNEVDEVVHLRYGKIQVVVPVWTCGRCGERWTDHEAERLRDQAVREASLR